MVFMSVTLSSSTHHRTEMEMRSRWLALLVVLAVGVGCSSPAHESKASRTSTGAVVADVDGSPPSMKEQMQAWALKHADVMFDLVDTFDSIQQSANAQDPEGMVAACYSLRREITRDQMLPPIPDPAVNDPWQSALSEFERAADLCIEGGETLDSHLLRGSADALDRGTAYMNEATAALGAYE